MELFIVFCIFVIVGSLCITAFHYCQHKYEITEIEIIDKRGTCEQTMKCCKCGDKSTKRF